MKHIGRKIRCDMNKTKMVIAAAIAVLLANADAASKVTYRDSLGRQQGTATTDSRGKTTYRDSLGRQEYLGLDPWRCVIFRRLVCFFVVYLLEIKFCEDSLEIIEVGP